MYIGNGKVFRGDSCFTSHTFKHKNYLYNMTRSKEAQQGSMVQHQIKITNF